MEILYNFLITLSNTRIFDYNIWKKTINKVMGFELKIDPINLFNKELCPNIKTQPPTVLTA